MSKVLTLNEDILKRLSFIRTRKQEYFICFSLNSNYEIIARRTVTIGTLNASLVHPREVFAYPLKDRAAAVIIAHNHPSGSVIPSTHDKYVTEQLVEAGKLLGIPVIDHVIVSKDADMSFRKQELLPATSV